MKATVNSSIFDGPIGLDAEKLKHVRAELAKADARIAALADDLKRNQASVSALIVGAVRRD